MSTTPSPRTSRPDQIHDCSSQEEQCDETTFDASLPVALRLQFPQRLSIGRCSPSGETRGGGILEELPGSPTASSQSVLPRRSSDSRRQGRYWILTIPEEGWDGLTLPGDCVWAKGQLECGSTGYRHWQIVAGFERKCSCIHIREVFGPYHCELTRSKAAEQYVWKEDTAVPGTRFELGSRPFHRNSATDWDAVWDHATRGEVLDIPANIRVRSYFTIRRIFEDYMVPLATARTTRVFWGATGTGKSRTAWEEAGASAYIKNPNSKFWSGYKGERNVIIDEFRGKIDVSYLLTWCDRYPVHIETKGGGRPAMFEKIWIISNLHPKDWYEGLDEATLGALLRRFEIIHFLGTPRQALMPRENLISEKCLSP